MSINRTDLVAAVQRRLDVGRREASAYVEALLEAMAGALRRGERLKISRLGQFSVHQLPARMGHHPRTGAPLPIPARKSVRFRAATALKGRINAS